MREGENEREMFQKNKFNLNFIYIYLYIRPFRKFLLTNLKRLKIQGYFNVGSLKAH